MADPGSGRGPAVEVAPGLRVRFTGLPGRLRRRLEERLAWQLGGAPCAGETGLEVESVATPPDDEGPGESLLSEPPLTVTRRGERLRFELPGVVTWCEPGARRAVLTAADAPPAALDLWAQRVLPALLAAAAEPYGWLLLHAASVARRLPLRCRDHLDANPVGEIALWPRRLTARGRPMLIRPPL